MNMLQLEDRPSGDEHYLDLEDKETHRATGSGCNPHAPIWDPEKMELGRMVDRLLEKRRYLPPRHVEQPVPHKVKLPPFWEKDTAPWFKLAWFKLVEAVLEDNRVSDPRTVILHIPHHMLERARGVLSLTDTMANPFKELKDRLVEILTPRELSQCTSILWGAERCGRRPKELMEVMLASLPQGELPGKLFKIIFLHCLPGDLKDLMAVHCPVPAAGGHGAGQVRQCHLGRQELQEGGGGCGEDGPH